MGRVMAGLACAVLTAGVLIVAVPGESGAGGGGRNVSIQHHQFEPRELTVNVGDEVTWTHRDGEQVHSVTADDGSFDSNPNCSAGNPKECMSDHDTYKHTFGAEGRFPYFSKTWGASGGQGASGVIIVVTPPPPPAKKGAPGGSTTTTAPAGGSAPPSTATTATTGTTAQGGKASKAG